MISSKKNDWVAINLNAPEGMSVDALHGYGITPDNTGLQSEDYYKSQKQVINTFTDKNGKFDEERFHAFYESAQRSYNDYQNEDFTKKLLDDIESSPYDIFSLGDVNIMDTSAIMYRSKDPQRTTMGLGNIYEVGTPTFDVREVAQANKARDEYGNILDWSPNDRGGLFKGLFRPAMALGTWNEDQYDDNGILLHKAGDLKYDKNGDPFYEKIGNKEAYGKETLHYWDTITRDDSAWNKIDFMDSDGLTKSLGGTIAKTAFQLVPYFIPGVGEVMGWIGASVALSQTLPVLAKGLDGIIMGTADNEFGRNMTWLENVTDRFRTSQSRAAMGKFLSMENLGDIISSSAGQLFQQRMIGQVGQKLLKSKDMLGASKIGQRLSLGYMAATSATDTYQTFKEAGADDRTAGVAVLGYMAGLYGLMNINYFKDMLFTNTWLDEDIALRDTMQQLVKETTIEPFKTFAASTSKPMTELERRFARTKLYKAIQEKVAPTWKKWMESTKAARPTIHQLDNAVVKEGEKAGISVGMRASMYLSRAMNEGIEETMEEGLTDVFKAITLGLDSLGVKVTKDDKQLDFGLSLQDAMLRYVSSFIGGAIGGAVFEGFNHWEGGPYDSLLEKSLVERLTWYERNGYDKEIRERIDNLYRKGKLGNKNLSSKGKSIKSVDGKRETVVFGEGSESDNQNLFVYNVINSYLDRLNSALANNGLFTSDNEIFTKIWESVKAKRGDDGEDPEVKLYHFLEDLDTAKALTIQEMGFLNAVKEDADKLAYDILRKDGEIKKVKDNIRKRNNITDANRSIEDELFKNNQYLKTLEKELSDMKKAWDQILNGERNGYYMGYAAVMANGSYLDLYDNPNPSVEVFKNLQEVFPKTGIENWTKYTYGFEFESITDDDLKKKIQDEYSAYLNLSEKDKMRKIYDMHIQFSEKFAPDIMAINKKFAAKKAVNPVTYFTEFLGKYSESIGHAVGKRVAADLTEAFKQIDNSKLPEQLAVYQKMMLLEGALNQVFPDIAGYDTTKDKLNFIKALNQSLTDDNAIMDTKLIRNGIMKSIIDKDTKRIADENKVNTPDSVNARLNNRLGQLSNNLVSSTSELDAFLDSLSDEELASETVFSDYINSEDRDQFLAESGEQLGQAIENILQDKNRLLSVGSERTILMSKLNDILDAIARNSDNVQSLYENAIKYLSENSGLTESEAKSFIDEVLFPDGTNLVDFTVQQQKIERANRANAIEELLEKFDIYIGGKIYNTIKLLRDQEAYMERLARPEEYSITSKTIEKELETALSFLRAITAVINSTVDGTNEQINLSRDGEQLAITDESLVSLYNDQLLDVVNRINRLLEVSRQNRLKTTKVQQDTMLNMNKLRVQSLKNIGKINFDGIELDFEKIWADTGFNLSDFKLDKSKDADKAYRQFQSEVSKQLKPILAKYLSTGEVPKFIEALVSKFGTDVYRQDPGVFSDDPNIGITPYSNVTYLLTLASIDAAEFDSLWKSITGENPDLIPISSQEYLVREAFAHIVDFKNGNNVFDTLHVYIQSNFPDSISQHNKDYVKGRGVAKRFLNIDGIGGTGKTTGVDYLLDRCLKKYYDGVSSTASSITLSAAENLHSALRLGNDNIKPTTIQDIIDTISKDADGKVIFDFNTAYESNGTSYQLKRNKEGEIIDGKDNKLSNVKNVDFLFNDKNGLRILYIDESGLVNRPQMELLLELANRFNFFIVGSGDVLQNKAQIKTKKGDYDQTGIEDLVYHRTPSLTISMRSENNGKYKNTEAIKDVLRKVSKNFFVDPSIPISKLNDAVKTAIGETIGSASELSLIYADSNLAGDRLIRSSEVLDFSKKMLTLVKELAENETDPSKKHQLAIVVDDEAKANNYRNQLASFGDSVIVIDSKKVQGREYDYVIVDKSFNETNPYDALTDFYTMMTRAKIGSAIVDDKGVIKSLNIGTHPDDTASEPVLGSDPETRAQLFKEYSDWRKSLMEDIPDFARKTTSAPSAPTPSGSSGTSGFSSGGSGTGSVTPTVVLNGPAKIDEELAEKLKSKNERDAYYTQKLLEGKSGHPYYQKLLEARTSKAGKNGYIDFDTFISELKDFDNDFFETHPLSIANGKTIVGTDAKMAYRSIISIIARAILNNKTAGGRSQFIQSATDYLKDKLNKIGLSANTFCTDLALSFENGGFFVCNNGHIFYTFETSGQQIAVPISTYTDSILNDSYFENLEFNIEIGSIPVSTIGEVFVPVVDALSEIDGIVLDKNGNQYVGVVTYTDELKNAALNFFKNRDDSDASRKASGAFRYLQGNSGKSMLAVSTASSRFEDGDAVFNINWKNGKPTSATNKEYDTKNLAQETAMIGIQQITNIQDWFRAVSILYRVVRHKEDITNSDSAWLDSYFSEEHILDKFNAVTAEDRVNIAANYKTLASYKVLNREAVNGLSSAIFRFLNSEGVNENFRMRFWQNFIKWLGDKKSNDDTRIHRKGFGINFKDAEGNAYIFSVIPKPNQTGYDIVYQDSNNPTWQTVASNPNAEINTLFSGTQFDFVQAITKTLSEISNSNIAADEIKNIVIPVESDLDASLSDGSVIVFPIDLYTDSETEQIVGYYSPFETDIYHWMVQGDTGLVEMEAGVLDALSEFLQNDTIFKNNMYRNIAATPREGGLEGWAQSKMALSGQDIYTDVTKIIAPLYVLGTTSKVDPESETGKQMKAKIGNFFSLNNDDSGPTLNIDDVMPPTLNGMVIKFTDGKPKVNSDWISEFTTSDGDGGSIESINIGNNTITLSNGTSYILNNDGLNALLTIPAVKSVVDKNIIKDVSGKITIVGNTISIALDGSGRQEFSNAYLIGVNENTYSFETSSGIKNVTLSEEMANKLNRKDKQAAINRGIYLGEHQDEVGTSFHVYYTPTDLVLVESNDPSNPTTTIPISSVTRTPTAIYAGVINFINPEIINNFAKVFNPKPDFSQSWKTDVGNGIMLVARSPVINGSWMQGYTDDTVDENKSYRILAYDNDRLGIYTDDDLSTFIWVSRNDKFNSDEIGSGDATATDIVDLTENAGIDWSNPAEAILQVISKTNEEAIAEFADLESDESTLIQWIWENGDLDVIEQSDIEIEGISVKSRRAIYKYLKSIIAGEISDVKFLREGSFDNEITAEFKVDGKTQQETFKVAGDRVVPLKPEVKSAFEAIESEFNSVFDTAQNRFNALQEQLSAGITMEAQVEIQNELNELSIKLNAMQAVKDAIANPSINKNSIIEKLKLLDAATRRLVLQYYKANNNKNKC